MATVSKRIKDNDSNVIGKINANPLSLDTCEYECALEDGSVLRYHANVRVDNIYSQCDTGVTQLLLTSQTGTLPRETADEFPRQQQKGESSYVNGKTINLIGPLT